MLIPKEICDKLSDVEIIKKSIENIDYFSCLYEKYEAKLLRYIKRITILSDEEVEDILQDAFIKIWKNLNDFDHDMKLSSWIYRIVHNEAVSHWRKSKSFGKDSKVEIDENLMENMAESIEIEIDSSKTVNNTNDILNQLSAKYKEVLILKFFEKMSYEEISDVLRIPAGTVATRINRAKKAFAKLSKDKGI